MQKSYIFWLTKKFSFFFVVILLVVPFLWISLSGLGASAACITYSSSSKSITVSCTTTTHLTAVNSVINNVNVLKKESTGVWLLAANLVVSKGANLVIDSTDGTWLKIRSDGVSAYGLKNSGTLTINSIKITSWNTATNNYASQGSSGSVPRAYIVAMNDATGKMDIRNSEIAYLGYDKSAGHGLDYYGGATGSLIENNHIHHLWRAFYSSGVGGITFTKNVVHDSIEYGIDPHSGTHDIYITYNKVYNNNHGIICSVMCNKIHITNNEVYNNKRDGIFMDSGSHHSWIANNIIHDEEVAIQLPSLSYSSVYGNTITNSKYGMKIYTQTPDDRCGDIGCVSVSNQVYDNHIGASNIAIEVKGGASSNTFTHNTLDGINGNRGIVVDGSKTSNNIFNDNHISNAIYPIRVIGGNTNSKFINNHLDTGTASGEFTLTTTSWLKLESTQFSSDVIKSLDSHTNKISISKSGTISVIDGSTTKKYDTNAVTYAKTLASKAKITVTSSSPSLTSTLGTESTISETNSASSITYDQKNNSAYTKRSQFGNETNSNNPESVERQSVQQQAKHAKDLAEQQVTNKRETDEVDGTDSSSVQRIMEEQHQTQDKVKSNHDNLLPEHTTTNKGPNKSESDAKNKGTDYSRSRSQSQYQEQHPKHQTVLTLTLIKEKGGQSYILAGKIWDTTDNRPLQEMPLFFTADPPIKIADETSNKEGAFSTNTLSIPNKPGIYNFQGHFRQDKHETANSNIVSIKVDENQSPDELLSPDQREIEDKYLQYLDNPKQKKFVNATTNGIIN